MERGANRFGVPLRLILTLMLGTLLNPLNSSMIAIALVPVQHSFGISVATVSWIITAFYLMAAVGQPLMGRFIDQFGARPLFIGGLAVVFLASVAAPFVPGFWWLVGIRVVYGIGTSTAFPAALVLIRSEAGRLDPEATRPPAAALGALAVAASTSAAAGPVLGGFLVAAAGWQAVFLVNIPLTVMGIIAALRILPRARPADAGDKGAASPRGSPWRQIDLPGIVLFIGTLTRLLVFLLNLADHPRWWLLPVVILAGVLLILRERAVADPFIDVRGLAANPALRSVLTQQGGVNLVFYCVMFGMPIWLQSVRDFGSDLVGVMMLPVALVGVVTTPLAARLIARRGSAASLLLGSTALLVASVLVQLLGGSTPILAFMAIACLFGIPNGFNNLGLQTALYDSAPSERTGSAGGLFQTFRYLGAILATSVIGVIFERDLTNRGLHHLGYVMAGLSVIVLALTLLLRRSGAKQSSST